MRRQIGGQLTTWSLVFTSSVYLSLWVRRSLLLPMLHLMKKFIVQAQDFKYFIILWTNRPHWAIRDSSSVNCGIYLIIGTALSLYLAPYKVFRQNGQVPSPPPRELPILIRQYGNNKERIRAGKGCVVKYCLLPVIKTWLSWRLRCRVTQKKWFSGRIWRKKKDLHHIPT